MFLAIVEGSDKMLNHAVGIFNNQIFDSNEDKAIPLSQEGLNYCVSTSTKSITFEKFAGGFFFRETSEKQRIKRRAEGLLDNDCFTDNKKMKLNHIQRNNLKRKAVKDLHSIASTAKKQK